MFDVNSVQRLSVVRDVFDVLIAVSSCYFMPRLFPIQFSTEHYFITYCIYSYNVIIRIRNTGFTLKSTKSSVHADHNPTLHADRRTDGRTDGMLVALARRANKTLSRQSFIVQLADEWTANYVKNPHSG